VGWTEEVWRPLAARFFGNEGIWARLERGEVPFRDFTSALRGAIVEAGGSVSEEQRPPHGRARPMATARACVRPCSTLSGAFVT